MSDVQCIAISRQSSEQLQSISTEGLYDQVKRAIDIVLCSLALIASIPILLVASLLICLETPGAAIFKQRRVGAGGKLFDIYKLRTMKTGTAAMSCVTAKNDPRVTRIGKLLRATKIDELPQLVNIIRGDMSIIGPRPLSEDECNQLVRDGMRSDTPGFIPNGQPGLIGLEQLNRHSMLSYQERFALNWTYESNLTMVMDLDIFLRSVAQCRVVVYSVAVAFIGEIVALTLLS